MAGAGVPARPHYPRPRRRPVRARWAESRHYAALDLGTNNCRLLIARPQGAGFTVVDAFSRIVRLGEGLATSGRLSDAAIDRTLAALRDLRRQAHVAATSRWPARSRPKPAAAPSNGREFIERVYRETGIALDIITAEEEARLAVLGCHALLEPGDGPALMFDIGGGSTELVLVDSTSAAPRMLDWHSAPWGVVSLTEAGRPSPTGPSAALPAYAEMRARVRGELRAASSRGSARRRARRGCWAPAAR